MDHYFAYAVAESRREEFASEAAAERQLRGAAKRIRQAEPRSGPRRRQAPRAVTA
jgi:hypothetical protein